MEAMALQRNDVLAECKAINMERHRTGVRFLGYGLSVLFNKFDLLFTLHTYSLEPPVTIYIMYRFFVSKGKQPVRPLPLQP